MTAKEANERLVGEKEPEVGGRMASALESANVTCERLQDKTILAARGMDRVVRGHAYEAIGVAFGIGLLIGVLVGRR